MTKLKKFDPQNRKKDMSHEEMREYKVVRNKPIQKERSGGNRQRFMSMVSEEDTDLDDNDDVYPYDTDNEFHTQNN
jgi:hypothetical protein